MPISRVRTVLQGPQIVGGGVSDLYFSETGVGDINALVAAVAGFWDDLAPGLHSGNSADVDPAVSIIDETNGQLTAVQTASSNPPPVPFTGSGDPLPPATQGLLQWHTGAVANGRQVRGRLFIPAPEEPGSTLGKPTAAAIALFQGAANALLTSGVTLVVWHRPGPSGAGSKHNVLSATVWTEWAVLRSRRD